jgi:hypothetical protein
MEWRGAGCGLKENRTLQVAILPFNLSGGVGGNLDDFWL